MSNRSVSYLLFPPAATASVAALQTTSGAGNLTLAAAAGTGAFHDTDQACKLTITSTGNISGVAATHVNFMVTGDKEV